MKHFLRIAAFLAACAFASTADAATCFWVGGTGSWSTANTASWASGTGGTASTCAATGGIPKQSGDVATFDALSGGGTVTVDSTMNGTTLNTLTMGAFTGTLDFSVNNPSMTFGGAGTTGINISGSGTRTIKLGSGTFTLKGHGNNAFDATTTTGLTYDTTSTATFNIVQDANPVRGAGFITGSLSFTNNTINISGCTDGEYVNMVGSATFKALTISGTGQSILRLTSGTTITITNALNLVGSNTLLFLVTSDNWFAGNSKGTMAVAVGSTISWGYIVSTGFTGTTVTATSSFDGGNNTGVTISGPAAPGGGSGRIIGG